MKQMINCYENSSNSQSSVNSDTSYILFWNKGGYVAFMEAIYEVNGGVEQQSTVSMSVGMIRKLFIPIEATNIELNFYMIDSGWILVGREFLPTMTQSCYAMWGTIFYPVYSKIECNFDASGFDGSFKYIPNQVPCTCSNSCNSQCNIVENNSSSSIKVTNKSLGIIKFTISFKFGGKIRIIDSPKILALQNRKIKIPSEATNISLSIFIYTGSAWKTVHFENFGAPLVICYEVTGSVSGPRCNLVKC